MRKTMKKTLAFLIVASLLMSTLMFTTALAGNEEDKSNELIAAEALHSIGLLLGLGDDADGNPVFGLEDGATRVQGLIMLLRFFGEFEEALESESEHPFADVTDAYNSPIVGYAFEGGITKGVSETRFDPTGELTAAHYLTFILRALGYEDGTDFEWNAAWELTDKLGITSGEFDAANNELLRGSLAVVSLFALEQPLKDSDKTLLEKLIGLETVPEDAAKGIAAATAKIKENNKPVVPTPSPTPTPVPSGGGGGGGGSNGGGTNPTPTPDPDPTPIPAWNIKEIPNAQVGDYVELFAFDELKYIYVEVETAGQITVDTPGMYGWQIISADFIVISGGGRTTNLAQVFESVYGISLGPGDYVVLYNLLGEGYTGNLAVGEDGQAGLQDGVYVAVWIYYAEDVIISVDGKTKNLYGNPSDFVQLRDLHTYENLGYFEVGEGGEVAIEDGVYVVSYLISGKDIMIPVDGKITVPDAIEGYVAQLVDLTEGQGWWYRAIDENGQVENITNGKYYLNSMIPLVTSVDGKITGLGSFGLNEFDYMILTYWELGNPDWGNSLTGIYRVGEGSEVQIQNGSYLIYETFTSSVYISSVNGATVNLKSRGFEYSEGDYVWLSGLFEFDNVIWGYFRVGANGEVAVADGVYNHWEGDYIPAAQIFIITPPEE